MGTHGKKELKRKVSHSGFQEDVFSRKKVHVVINANNQYTKEFTSLKG